MKKLQTWSGIVAAIVALQGVALVGCGGSDVRALQTRIDSLQTVVNTIAAERQQVAQNLRRFDSLDFDVYSHAKWDQLSVSHDEKITVNYPDGHQTTDIAAHIEELKPLFVFAPDTRIVEHPVKFGDGDYTCVTGYILGTFSKPMPIGNGKTIPPTGTSFKLPMATVGHWKNGRMIEESLYWDNQAFMKQIGLAK